MALAVTLSFSLPITRKATKFLYYQDLVLDMVSEIHKGRGHPGLKPVYFDVLLPVLFRIRLYHVQKPETGVSDCREIKDNFAGLQAMASEDLCKANK